MESKLLRAYINRPTEHVLKIRAVQLGVSKEKLVGHILSEWSKESTMDSTNYQTAQESLQQYIK